MKIAFLSFYSGNVNRGGETFVHNLANNLVAIGHEIIVYQNGSKLPASVYKVQNLKSLFSLPKIDSDVEILFPTNGRIQAVLSKLWCLVNNKKIVISGQSGSGRDDRFNLWMFPNAFVGLSHYQTLWAKKANPFVKTATIPNGVDLKKFSLKISPEKFNLPRPIILCVSALITSKRLDLVIRATAKLNRGSLLLVGSGDEQNRLQKLGDKLLPDRFKIISVTHEEMPSIYKSADLFTFATVPWESFGIVLVEAMATGLPVVCSNDPIRREIVGEAGLLVDPENTQEYAAALQKALDTNWGDLPRKQAEKFSWDKIAKQYDQIFRNITSL